MKKIVLMLALMIATMTVAAENILYFTYNQAARTVATLNNQNELMIYCGYEDELPTYVLINEVWAEQISSSFYEIWLYGYDAYTGEEVYMPIDLECIYLMQNRHIYSAAQYLRFKYTHSRPTFSWAMPPYNPYVRAPRPHIYYYTYHYDIHRPGWHYRDYGYMHYHPYYRRLPSHPAPMPPKPFTPGHDRPGYHEDPHGNWHYTNEPLVGNITASRSKVEVRNDPTQRSGNRITSSRTDNTITVTDRATGSRTVSPAPSRTGEVSSDNTRGTSTTGRGTSTGSDNTRGTSTSRSGVSTNDNNGRGSGTTSRGTSATTSDSPRSATSTSRSGEISSDNGNSRSTSRTSAGDNKAASSTSRTSASDNKSTSNTRGTATSSTGRGSNVSGAAKDDSKTGTSAQSSRSTSSSARGTTSNRSTKSTATSDDGKNATSSTSRGSSRSTRGNAGRN